MTGFPDKKVIAELTAVGMANTINSTSSGLILLNKTMVSVTRTIHPMVFNTDMYM